MLRQRVARQMGDFAATAIHFWRAGMVIDRYVMLFLGMMACESMIFIGLISARAC